MKLRSVIGCGLMVAAMLGAEPAGEKSAPDGRSLPPAAARDGRGAPSTQPARRPFAAVAGGALDNAHYVTDKLIAGAQPEGEAGFAALRDLGVRTIISVDGARPDLALAHKYGLSYIHLPIGYDGVAPAEGKAIAKAIAESPGRIYLHCHHGKHRSAAAAAVACVYNGMLRPQQAETVLETFGTGANYKGLWKAARDARPLDPKEIEQLKVTFVEQSKIPPLAEAMVAVDERFDHLKAIEKAGWKTPANHPDLDPPHEALQLEEQLHELHRISAEHRDQPQFARLLDEGESAAAALKQALSSTPPQSAAADAAFKAVGHSCTACHQAFRD